MSIHQVIIVIKDIPTSELIQISVKAGMEIMNQFDPSRSNYSGSNEHNLFNKDYNAWIETNCEQKIYVVEDERELKEIDFLCNLEGAPTNFITNANSNKILVIGPFDSNRLNYFTKNCTSLVY